MRVFWRGRRRRNRDDQDAGEGVDLDARGFFACVVSAAARAAFLRLMRSFFFAWPLRRLIFSELRRSMLPIACDSSGKNQRQSAQARASSQEIRTMFVLIA